MPTDPVCGMYVPETSDLFLDIDGERYYFCSSGCLEKYRSPEAEEKKLRYRLILGWLISVPVLLITYLVHFEFRNYILLVLALPVQFYSGLGFYNGAYHSLKSRSGNMDLLISVGTLTAFFFSAFITFFPGHIPSSSVYYDASVFIITMILTGNYIENLTKIRANKAASKLISMIPDTTHLITPEGEIKDVMTGEIREGDRILVKPGEIISVDGIIFDGRSEVDESMMTGEQEPVFRGKNDPVTSGTKNINGVLRISVTRTGKNTTVNRIYEMIQKAATGRAKIQRISDVFSSVFVPVVVTAALAAALFWYFYLSSTGYGFSGETAILAFVSVIVIACPCAIGLAGPITLLISSNVSSENGIIVKNASALDRLSKTTRVILDKTGTLTDPEPVVSDVSTEPGIEKNYLIGIAASIEKSSNHPVAKAIVALSEELKIDAPESGNITEIPGKGITGTVDGKNVELTRSGKEGGSVVSAIIDGTPAGSFTLSYRIRESAEDAVKQLKAMGIKTAIVTGDAKDEAERVADILGIEDVHYKVLPDQKAEIVKDYQMAGDYVVFVGDGINDSVALEMADVGIAMASGTDIARESGDIILLSNDLRHIFYSKIIGDKTIAKIKQNIGWAIGYNSALIPVAGGILVPFFGLSIYSFLPILAAFAMGMSSSSVVINSLLLKRGIRKVIYGDNAASL